MTLTRIFLLTHEHQSLVREITTPSLPGFVTACLKLIEKPHSFKSAPECHVWSPLLTVVLHALSELIVMHPTSFRPFVPHIRSLIYSLIAPTSSNLENENDPISTSALISESARHLFVLLHASGPKNTAGEEWAKSLNAVISSVQRTADKVFRSLVEHRTSSSETYDTTSPNLMEDVVSDAIPSPLALPAWTGIDAGIERLDGLLHTLQAFLATGTTAAVSLPVSDILAIADRIMSVLPPGSGRNPRVRVEIGRDEREGLWAGLPRLHVSVIGVSSLMISRMGDSCAAIASTIMEQLLWTLESQQGIDDFRKAAYGLVSQILSTFGPSLPRTYAHPLSRCIRMCCEDLLPSVEHHLQDGHASSPDAEKSSKGTISATNADSYLKSTTNQADVSVTSSHVLQEAQSLLHLSLTNLPYEYLPFSLRCQIDRTAIITQNKKTMLASVMNVNSKRKEQKSTSSILPLLARAHPESLEVEVLLRPRMPPIQYRQSDGKDTESEDLPQNGESEEFYQDPRGINANVNVEGNNLMEHGETQIEATSGAVEESSSSGLESRSASKSAASLLPEPISAFSHTPTKRDREKELDSDKEDRPEREMRPASKRSRLGLDETPKESLLGQMSAESAVIETGGIGHAVMKTQAPDSVAVSGRPFNVQEEDSDESEFEMPILNMDSGSDEEEEEEDD